MPGLNKFLMEDVEMPLVRVVADLEDTGYLIDQAFFNSLGERLEPVIAALLKRIRRKAGREFNPASNKHVQELLYKKLKVKVTKRTPAGEPSTDNSVLKAAARKHKVAQDLLEYRKLTKVLSTYASIPEEVDEDGRLRVTYNQLAAATGRFSSASVIQTIPKKNDPYQLRKGFIAREGYGVVGADFDQQELRVLAHCSGDTAMKAAIKAGVDLHGLAAVKVFQLGCEPNEVKEKFNHKRDQIKAVQFGIIYGKTAYSLAADLGISIEDAEQLIAGYFDQYRSVKRFIDRVHRNLLRDGYVDDVFGRRRYFPDALRRPPRKEWRVMTEEERTVVRKIGAAKRAAQNFVIQGASATITKLAMLKCHRHVTAEHPEIKMLLTLHDELQFEVPCELVDHFAQELPSLMCELDLKRFGFTVPMAVEVKVGPSWGEMAKWEGTKDG